MLYVKGIFYYFWDSTLEIERIVRVLGDFLP